MKAIANRLRRLEDQLGPAGGKPRDYFRIVLIRLDRIPGLEGDNVTKDDDAERQRKMNEAQAPGEALWRPSERGCRGFARRGRSWRQSDHD